MIKTDIDGKIKEFEELLKYDKELAKKEFERLLNQLHENQTQINQLLKELQKKTTFIMPCNPLMFTVLSLFAGKPVRLPAGILEKPADQRTPEEQKIIDEIINSIVINDYSQRDTQGNIINQISYISTDNQKIKAIANIDRSLFKEDAEFKHSSIAIAIKKAYGVEGLRHLLGIFIALNDEYHNGYFVFDINRHLERLGYQKRESGNFKVELKRKASEIIQLFCGLRLITHSKEKSNKEKIDRQALFMPSGERIFKEFGEIVNVSLDLTLNPKIFDWSQKDSKHKVNPYTKLLREIAKVNHRDHPITIYLGVLLPVFWRFSGKEQLLSIKSIFNWLDIEVKQHRLKDQIKDLFSELDFMKANYYLGDWKIKDDVDVFSVDNPLNVVLILPPPDWFVSSIQAITNKKQQYKIAKEITRPITKEDIDKILQTKKLTVRQLANTLNVSHRLIYYITQGKLTISDKLSKKIKETYSDVIT